MDIIKSEKIIRNGEFQCYSVILKNGNLLNIPDKEDNKDFIELKRLEREGKIEIEEKKLIN